MAGTGGQSLPGAVTFSGTLDSEIASSDSPSIDAFGRWRSSNPETLFDSKMINDDKSLFWITETTGSGSTSYNANQASFTLSVGSTPSTSIRETKMRFNYQPGKSQLILMTGIMGASSNGIEKNMGVFDNSNGLFLSLNSGDIAFVRRTNTSGTPVDSSVLQASWNIDTMDGGGDSGIDIDFTKTQILIIDFEWLGVGRVRMGFVVDGKIYYAHEFLNANVLSLVYMSSPNLPLCYEISKTGTQPANEMVQICSTVISEGGSDDLGITRYASTNGTHVDANTEDTIYAIIGIRLKAARTDEIVKLVRAAIQIQTGAENGEWILKLNPTVAGTFTYVDESESPVQIARGATANTVTGGTDVDGGFAQSGTGGGGSGSSEIPINNALYLGLVDRSGTLDEIVLCWRPTGGTSGHDIEGSLVWKEIS